MTVSVSLSYPATTCINTNLTGLEEFNNYTVTVRAVNSIGSSEPSTGVTAQTNASGSFRILFDRKEYIRSRSSLKYVLLISILIRSRSFSQPFYGTNIINKES